MPPRVRYPRLFQRFFQLRIQCLHVTTLPDRNRKRETVVRSLGSTGCQPVGPGNLPGLTFIPILSYWQIGRRMITNSLLMHACPAPNL
jgi:hypothetical protein